MKIFSRFSSLLFLRSCFAVFLVHPASLHADSATWSATPGSDDWNTATNWVPTTVPNGPSDTATFATSDTTTVSLSADTTVASTIFDAGASAYTISAIGRGLIFAGAGVVNDSGLQQNFLVETVGGTRGGLIAFTGEGMAGNLCSFRVAGNPRGGPSSAIRFFDNASAGSSDYVAEGSQTYSVGRIQFHNHSSAGTATFNVTGSRGGHAGAGEITFYDYATAAQATFNTRGGSDHGIADGAGGILTFNGNSTAANTLIVNHDTSPGSHGAGFTAFNYNATADHATIINSGGTADGKGGGGLQFLGAATAGRATITNQAGAVPGSSGGFTYFYYGGNGGNATIINEGSTIPGVSGGFTEFANSAVVGDCTIVADGGSNGAPGGVVYFSTDSVGGPARLCIFGNGYMYMAAKANSGITVGSIEGDGQFDLGKYELVVGTNNRSTTFSGLLSSNGSTGSALVKIGTGNLILTNQNSFNGTTTVDDGILTINSHSGSGTGPGPVFVDGGTLAGNGIIGGAVTAGTGNGAQASIAPGNSPTDPIGALALQSAVVFKSNGVYSFELDSGGAVADSLSANGVTINAGAEFFAADLGAASLALGTTFTAINNTAAIPITGTFANLADGAILTVNDNKLQADYEGGDGNDLILTVVP